ncbi:MAG TPA: hypothetical protein VIU35_07835 [Chitinophagaceae bacterium]
MKKILFLLFILIVNTGYSQNPIQSTLKNYFRTHPFDMKFSNFIASLQQDPWFTIETYGRRTDTSFFFITGTYKNFNPFRFIPKELRLIVAEEEIIHTDSLKTLDTIMNLQLLAISDSGEINSKLVEKEFKRFHNIQAGRFSSNTSNSFKEKDGSLTVKVYNYFVSPYLIAPVTIAWGILPGSNQYAFTITIRFKVKENAAIYVVSPGEL